ncbi:transmembrane protein 94-like isoform X1 [Mya arenaria]|uniref:transmembrane protein 94-like isoform X1 n=1 Tax=Mya arenaria TaxID=6604 RepID=UPI0022DF4D81|nr:transmembrane protein 94-like isoform X1 [Mya arenaria]
MKKEGPFSMSQALELLHGELFRELEGYMFAQNRDKWRHWRAVFHHARVKSLYHWTTILISLVLTVALFVAYGFSNDKGSSDSVWLVVEGSMILACVLFNVFLAVHTCEYERSEFVQLLRHILDQLSVCMKYNTWNKAYFPRLDAPFSPCCSLQWTMRDDQVYNIPVLLLVKGDIILLRPGHKAPAQCSLQHDGLGEDAEDLLLEENEIFAPDSGKHGEVFTQPKGRQPRKPARFLLLDTPATTLVRQILSDCKRPASTIEHEKFLIMTHWIERRIIPVVCVVMLVVNILRYIYLGGHVGHWTDMIILLQVQAIVPLVPLIVPLMYLLINFYGQARVFAAFEAEKGTKSLGDDSFDSDSSISADEARVDLPWPHVLEWFRNILLGRVHVTTRNVNVTHILGSVTSLCCVDKKGILSYPNPTPEKIFFLHREHAESGTSVTHSESKHATDKPKPAGKFVDHAVKSTCVEVLDVTSDPKNSFAVLFDDPSWKQHMNSLKPLGLTILANTCNLNTAQWYSQFTDHVACAGLENEETVAVINRRCLCALAREMGFSTNALNIFYQERTLGVYQQVSAEMTTKERLQRAKSFIQHKIPMPNMVSIILREKLSGACQMLSQGTADILLAHCTDFWDGEDLAPLTTSDRKKILDFYHRTSIGSYCTAFSYCPLRQRLLTGLEDVYIELPDDTQRSNLHGSLSSIDEDQDLLCDPVGGRGSWELPRSFSADSLTEAANIGSLEDVPTLVQAHNSQVFIGMVTMQYQARLDFIQLIDKLEGACIRFVHFSQENEVRSRVFAEKMGLEAGWNCHISLRSERQYLSATSANVSVHEVPQDEMQSQTCSGNPVSRNKDTAAGDTEDSLQASQRKISTSAPSVVHLGSSQVKFEPKVQTAIVSPRRLRREAAEDYHTATTEEILLLNTKQGEYEDEALLSGGEYSWMGEEEELSRHASSYITENTEDSLAFDNRAKLPRGIENIRPHLSSIDNVPLLVNLFTDCSPETTGEMIQIMQEHGEVVLCVGSSANTQNTPLFLRADCSLALEPLCPQVCLQQPPPSLLWDQDFPTPLQLASSFISVICPIIINKDGNISLIHLIAEARNQLMCLRNCFYFMLCCSLSVTGGQLVSSVVQLPTLLPPQHLLWLVLIVIPLLGLTMMGNPVDHRVMSLATSKNNSHLSNEMIVRFTVYYVLRFGLPVAVALICYGLTLHSYCQTLAHTHSHTNCAVFDFRSETLSDERPWVEAYSGGLVLAQNIFIFLLVLYFEIISLSFIHWKDHLWQQCPATNRLWLTITPLLLCGQAIFCVCDTYVRSGEVQYTMSLSDLHPAVWALGLSFPLIMIVINELVKHREIKVAVRYQKRARLNFGTKLGMNSPF